MNDWILTGWWPSVLDFAKMVTFSFWWLLAIGAALFVIFIFVLVIKLLND